MASMHRVRSHLLHSAWWFRQAQHRGPDCVAKNYTERHAIGDDFYAFGFPESLFGGDSRKPVPRHFRGYFQRFFMHQSHQAYIYVAGEMNIPSPPGLSGGPVWRPGTSEVFGVVAENLDSTTTDEAFEETDEDGVITRTRYQRVISYDVVVMLDKVGGWINTRARGAAGLGEWCRVALLSHSPTSPP